jgi:hypothetical protein
MDYNHDNGCKTRQIHQSPPERRVGIAAWPRVAYLQKANHRPKIDKTIVGYKHNDCSQLLWPWKAFIESVAEHWTRLNTTHSKRESFAGTSEKYD